VLGAVGGEQHGERGGHDAPAVVVRGQRRRRRRPSRQPEIGHRLPLVFGRTSARNFPVYEPDVWATTSGGPSATSSPPASPPSGPRSMTWSAHLMTSRWCSTTRTVLPASTSRCSTPSSFLTSSRCRPVV